MSCAWVQERLPLYQAGELEPEQIPRLVGHLEGCPACGALAEQLAETAARVEAALPTTVAAPATLHERVMAAVRDAPAPRRPWPALLPLPRALPRLALGTAMLCLIVIAFCGGRWDAARHLPRAVVTAPSLDLALLGAAHRRALGKEPAAGDGVAQPQQLARTLAPLLPFPVAVVDLPADGLRLLGGSRITVHGVPVAAVQYDWGGQRVTLFQVEARRLSPAALPTVVARSDTYFAQKRDGLTYVTWPFGRTHCVMVAQSVPMHRLFQLACHASEKLEKA